MKYHFFDPYREVDSFIHHLDPRAKFIATLALVTAIALVPRASWLAYGLFLVLIFVLLMLSRVPPLYVLKRSLAVLPFVVMIAIFMPFFKEGTSVWGFDLGSWHIGITREGLVLVGGIFSKAWLSMLALILLTATTSMVDLLKGLERLKMPSIMVMLMSFMYRYLFVISDESARLRLARDSRSLGGGVRLHVRTLGYMAGSLFLRSYERGERIYGAMLSRGFDGHSRSLNELSFRASDILFTALMILAAAAIGCSPLFTRSLLG
jgi:cobalt/nickel transport system permease protein